MSTGVSLLDQVHFVRLHLIGYIFFLINVWSVFDDDIAKKVLQDNCGMSEQDECWWKTVTVICLDFYKKSNLCHWNFKYNISQTGSLNFFSVDKSSTTILHCLCFIHQESCICCYFISKSFCLILCFYPCFCVFNILPPPTPLLICLS